MQLVLVALGRSATLEVTDVARLVRHHQGALELAGPGLVDPEVCAELHGALHPLGDVAKRPVGEHRRIQGRVEIVPHRNHGAQVLPNQLRVLLDRFAHAAEDDAEFGELVLEGRRHAHAVHHEVHRHPAESLLFFEGNAQLVHGLPKLRVHVVHRRQFLLLLGGRIVADGLEVGLFVMKVRPFRLDHVGPHLEGVQAPLQQPVRLVLLRTDESNDVFIQPCRCFVCIDVCGEAKLVGFPRDFLQNLVFSVVRHVCRVRVKNSRHSRRFDLRSDCGTQTPCR